MQALSLLGLAFRLNGKPDPWTHHGAPWGARSDSALRCLQTLKRNALAGAFRIWDLYETAIGSVSILYAVMGKCALSARRPPTHPDRIDWDQGRHLLAARLMIAPRTSQGATHAGRDLVGRRPGILRPVDRLRVRLRTPLRRTPMLIDYILGGVVTVALLIYLTYALLRPEKF